MQIRTHRLRELKHHHNHSVFCPHAQAFGKANAAIKSASGTPAGIVRILKEHVVSFDWHRKLHDLCNRPPTSITADQLNSTAVSEHTATTRAVSLPP